jgi:hypothetical protein
LETQQAGSEDRRKEIFIFVNEVRVGPFETDLVTGVQIKTKAGLPLNTDLFEKQGDHLVPIANDQTVKIHENQQFVDFPPTPVS